LRVEQADDSAYADGAPNSKYVQTRANNAKASVNLCRVSTPIGLGVDLINIRVSRMSMSLYQLQLSIEGKERTRAAVYDST
jgi:copper(I)-binding protein